MSAWLYAATFRSISSASRISSSGAFTGAFTSCNLFVTIRVRRVVCRASLTDQILRSPRCWTSARCEKLLEDALQGWPPPPWVPPWPHRWRPARCISPAYLGRMRRPSTMIKGQSPPRCRGVRLCTSGAFSAPNKRARQVYRFRRSRSPPFRLHIRHGLAARRSHNVL